MSYSFNNNCHNCKNKDKCTDEAKIRGAIDSIHQDGWSDESGHMGGGEIILLCQHHNQPDDV